MLFQVIAAIVAAILITVWLFKGDETMNEEHTCQWSEDFEQGKWDTACGESFVVIDGTPADNKMKYCCYCGKKLATS
jgi:hypothetical protein